MGKKDFKLGDKVTYIPYYRKDKIQNGFVIESDDAKPYGVRVLLDGGKELSFMHSGIMYAGDVIRTLYHGHNVTVKIEGEELPERMTVERVSVPLKGTSWESISGTMAYRTIGDIDLPADLARQVREYFKGVE
ncbi:MAG: hypothetical protein SVV67_08810 [Bacillota bacterium]|nr:hypothetical protein [Bacillota bacterium]